MPFTENLTAEDRVRIYGLLAEAFCEVPTEQSTQAVSMLARAMGIPCPQELPLDEVHREFMDVFVVPNPRYAAPYESVYRDEWLIPPASGDDAPRTARRLLMGESTLAVRQSFVEAGILPLQDLPDHIGNELRLVAHLWHVEARAGTRDGMPAARERARFVAEHPLTWIGALGDRVAESGSGYYRAAIEVAHALLRAESGTVPP